MFFDFIVQNSCPGTWKNFPIGTIQETTTTTKVHIYSLTAHFDVWPNNPKLSGHFLVNGFRAM